MSLFHGQELLTDQNGWGAMELLANRIRKILVVQELRTMPSLGRRLPPVGNLKYGSHFCCQMAAVLAATLAEARKWL